MRPKYVPDTEVPRLDRLHGSMRFDLLSEGYEGLLYAPHMYSKVIVRFDNRLFYDLAVLCETQLLNTSGNEQSSRQKLQARLMGLVLVGAHCIARVLLQATVLNYR